MINMILDKLPTEYNGYLIRSSFRIGIQICLCLQDPDYSKEEQMLIALNLLYGNGIPDDFEDAVRGLDWFMSCGEPHKTSSSSDKVLFYWDFDSSRLISSFMQTYNIDLTKEDMHWFKFLSLIGSLDKDSAFSKAVEIRAYDMSELKGKSRMQMQKMKEQLTPEVQYSQEEKEQMKMFDKLFDGGDVNG